MSFYRVARMADFDNEKLTALLSALVAVGEDLSLPLLQSLVVVARHGGISVNELAEEMDIPQQTASRYIAILQGRYQFPTNLDNAFAKRPLLSLEVSTEDPRRRALYLTDAGKVRIMEVLNILYTREGSRRK